MIENALAGILLKKPEIIADVSNIVFEDDFNDNRAATVYRLAKESFTKNEKFDLVIASTKMPQHVDWLASVYDTIPINHIEYARNINDKARAKRIKNGIANILATKFDDPEILLSDLTTLHKKESKSCAKDSDIKKVIKRTVDIINKNKKTGEFHGVSTGFRFLDEIYCRFIPGQMWVVTGFTSTGKTTLLIELLARLKENKVLVVSTEMTEEQLVSRMIARETGYHNQIILSGKLEGEEDKRLMEVCGDISSRNLVVVDDVLDIENIESLVNQESMRNNVDVVFIDYVQQIRAKGIPRREWGKEIAERIQQLAKRANTCIVCMSQVSNEIGRGVTDQFEAKGAGEWASCADVGVRLRRDSKDQFALLFDMQKGRHFGTTQKELSFMANFTRIDE